MEYAATSDCLSKLLEQYTFSTVPELKLLNTPNADREIAQLLSVSFEQSIVYGNQAHNHLNELIERVETIVNNFRY